MIQGEFPGGIDGLYASELVRTQETAAPLAELLRMQPQILPGLNELNAGILEGMQAGRLGEILYIINPFLWTLGLVSLPQWGSTIDPNGLAFDARFDSAVQTIYDNTVTNDGPPTDIAFSHAAAIMVWTMMNVHNPNPLLMFSDPLSNTSQVVIEGNPTDGWDLISWNGTPIGPADLGTELFVGFRNLIMAPQIAIYDLFQDIFSGGRATAGPELPSGLAGVANGITQFSANIPGDLTGELAGVPDVSEQVDGASGSALADALMTI